MSPDQQQNDHLDAQRFRKLCAILQGAYDGDHFEVEGLTAYCTMISGCRDERTVKAELIWKDERDAPLGLAESLDRIRVEDCGVLVSQGNRN